ncbi:D-lyxose/D-mannose family sugar isomerase [Enterococcus innesii]|uniref:D-lyxose/D-mannose family sugar isomerase n=1 Tax=Enterococcus innesii TaxID=2839759 RepID=UPI0020919984|nr:D-lyxose/D-mannose family sugar isomerase [Enterococcus innesii]MCO5497899.1 D-lyxose/D-mannose family sugar isomerase [Enterococcus innesii]
MNYQERVRQLFEQSGFIFSDKELQSIDFADFGLGNIEEEGLNLIVYINNDRYCAKEMVLLPYQTCPEHLHPTIGERLGKQETFRCRWGKVYLYVEGNNQKETIRSTIPKKNEQFYTVYTEIELLPGQQYTIDPDTKHWFQAAATGAVISEFSSPSDDASDIFTNPSIQRVIQ